MPGEISSEEIKTAQQVAEKVHDEIEKEREEGLAEPITQKASFSPNSEDEQEIADLKEEVRKLKEKNKGFEKILEVLVAEHFLEKIKKMGEEVKRLGEEVEKLKKQEKEEDKLRI